MRSYSGLVGRIATQQDCTSIHKNEHGFEENGIVNKDDGIVSCQFGGCTQYKDIGLRRSTAVAPGEDTRQTTHQGEKRR